MAIFRRYELVIGFLLGVAVSAFVAVMYGQNQTQDHKANQTTERDGAGQQPNREPFWVRATNDPTAAFTGIVALFTLVLAGSTIGLWIVTWRSGVRQSREMQASLAIAQQSADAAALQAKAIVQSELPLIAAQDFQVKAAADEPVNQTEIPEQPVLTLALRNFGRTPAEWESYGLETRYVKRLPEEPEYLRDYPQPPGTILSPGARGIELRDLLSLRPGRMRDALLREEIHLWVYGYVKYRDFLGNPHEMRFAALGLLHMVKPGTWFTFVYSSETPPAYSQRT
jgi:hypothetical protein